MVRGVRLVECGSWSATSGVWFMECVAMSVYARSAISGVRFVECGSWSVVG